MRGNLGVASLVLLACTGCTPDLGGYTPEMQQAWGTTMEVFRIALCVVGAAAIVPAALFIPRRGMWNLVAGVLACTAAFVIFLSYFDFFNPNVRYSKYYHRHEFFHAFVPAKYARELGYQRLYLCSIDAQRELPGLTPVKVIRDMKDGVLKPVAELIPPDRPELCKSHFSPERWEAFKRDVAFIEEESHGSYFDSMHKDFGVTESPVWVSFAAVFAAPFSASVASFTLLSLLDVALQAGLLALIGWAFGWRILLLATAFWACNAASTFYWTGGGYLAQLSLFFLVAATCLAKRNLPLLAGISLATAALLEPYAFVLFLGAAIAVAVRLALRRPIVRSFRRFFAGAAVALVVLLPASRMVTGPSGYEDYLTRLGTYSRQQFTNQVGLGFLLSHDSETRMEVARNDALVDPFKHWRELRLERMREQRPFLIALAIALALWTAWALTRSRRLWVTIALSFPLFMTLFSPTCQHLAPAMLLALAAHRKPALGALLLVLVGITQPIKHVYYVDDRYALMTVPLYLACLAALSAHSWSWTRRARRSPVRARPTSGLRPRPDPLETG